MTVKTVHLAVFDTLADWEPALAVAAVNDPQYQREPGSLRVRTVALDREPVTTMGGVRILPDVELDELDPVDSGMLVLSGAHTWDRDEMRGPWARAARRFLDAGTPVAAMCGATFGLAAEGLLDERDHTGAAAQVLAATGYAGGGRYREADAVRDRGLITAGPTDAVAFAREILAELGAFSPAVLEAWHCLYSTGDPRYFSVLMEALAADRHAAVRA